MVTFSIAYKSTLIYEFLSCFEPHYESEAKCKVFVIKISRHSYPNKTNFHVKSFAFSLAFIVRLIATRKWPIIPAPSLCDTYSRCHPSFLLLLILEEHSNMIKKGLYDPFFIISYSPCRSVHRTGLAAIGKFDTDLIEPFKKALV